HANLLFVRAEDPFTPDSPHDIERLATMLSQRVAGRFTLAWVATGPRAAPPTSSNIRLFTVRRPWPQHLSAEEITWSRNYGDGVAWRGHNGDWGTLLRAPRMRIIWRPRRGPLATTPRADSSATA